MCVWEGGGGGTHIPLPPIKKVGGTYRLAPPPPTPHCIYIYIYQWRRKMPKTGGAHRHVIYVPSVKNQYKRAVFGYMVIYEQPSVSVY